MAAGRRGLANATSRTGVARFMCACSHADRDCRRTRRHLLRRDRGAANWPMSRPTCPLDLGPVSAADIALCAAERHVGYNMQVPTPPWTRSPAPCGSATSRSPTCRPAGERPAQRLLRPAAGAHARRWPLPRRAGRCWNRRDRGRLALAEARRAGAVRAPGAVRGSGSRRSRATEELADPDHSSRSKPPDPGRRPAAADAPATTTPRRL